MQRSEAVEATLTKVRAVLTGEPNREKLDVARAALAELAGQAALWSEADFPPPDEEERQTRYLIAQDSPEGLTLYLNVMRPGKKIPPHDHTTWACVAAVDGVEHNTLWTRLDDGSQPGKAAVEAQKVVELGADATRSIALMPDDIHSVEIKGDRIIRHLHMYGRPLESLSERTAYDPEAGTCWIMPVGVKTRR
ncbi:MAG: cysteine dioxygenase [Kiloniellaceae bacterium]